jgi:hypothetical protein
MQAIRPSPGPRFGNVPQGLIHRRVRSMDNELQQLAFVAETETDATSPTVRFRYVIDQSAELLVPREWWEQLGAPESIEVSVRPQTQ